MNSFGKTSRYVAAGTHGKSTFHSVRHCPVIPTSSDERFFCGTSLLAFGVISVLDLGQFNRCVVALHRCLNLYSISLNLQCGSFYVLICHLYIFCSKGSLTIFGPFLIRLFIIVLKVLCMFWIVVLYKMCSLQISSSSLCLVFSFSQHCLLIIATLETETQALHILGNDSTTAL